MDNPYAATDQARSINLKPESAAAIATATRTMQIIAGALMCGTLTFSGVVLLSSGGNLPGKVDVLTMLGVGIGVAAVFAHFIVPMVVSNAQMGVLTRNSDVPDSETDRVTACCSVMQTKTIIGFALLEGATFFNLVAILIEKSVWSVVVAGVLFLLMAFRFPTRNQIEAWVEDKLRAFQRTG
ncbi:MAG: hypothetical protein R3C20_09170 [Planctomycetaceae bacterium]